MDETNIFGVDNSFVENAFVTIKNFGGILGLQLDVKKTKKKKTNEQTNKSMSVVRKWSKNRSTPLQLTWTRNSVKILGIYFSYDEKQNNSHTLRPRYKNYRPI